MRSIHETATLLAIGELEPVPGTHRRRCFKDAGRAGGKVSELQVIGPSRHERQPVSELAIVIIHHRDHCHPQSGRVGRIAGYRHRHSPNRGAPAITAMMHVTTSTSRRTKTVFWFRLLDVPKDVSDRTPSNSVPHSWQRVDSPPFSHPQYLHCFTALVVLSKVVGERRAGGGTHAIAMEGIGLPIISQLLSRSAVDSHGNPQKHDDECHQAWWMRTTTGPF